MTTPINSLFLKLSEKFGENPRTRLTTISFFLLAVIMLFAATAFSQDQPVNPGKGFQPGGGFAISDIETINTTNGNLILNIPLAGLPKGRGGVSRGISLVYNSKLYETTVEDLPDHSNEVTPQNWLVESNSPGWNYSNQMYMLTVKSRFQTSVNYQCGTYETAQMHNYLWKVSMYMPDGSQKEFRPSGYSDALGDGYFNVTANGWEVAGCSGQPGAYITTGPMTYYSTDGTYLKLVVDHVTGGTERGAENPWTLYTSDGGRVTGGLGLLQHHYDRNNNHIQGLTDDFGRSISGGPGDTVDEDHVIARGVNNEELKWKIKWKTISVSKSYETTPAPAGTYKGTTSTQTMATTLRVVEKITLPTQAGGLTYEFGYNSEAGGSGWGELSYIKLPGGAEVFYTFSNGSTPTTKDVLRNSPTTKTLQYYTQYDGGSPNLVQELTQYSIGLSSSTVTAPDGSATTETYGTHSYQNLYAGIVHKVEHPNGGLTERIWAFNRPPNTNGDAPTNTYVKTEFTTIPAQNGTPALTAIKDFTVDPNGNQIEVKEYEWVAYSALTRTNGKVDGIPGSAQLKRITSTEYYNSSVGVPANGYWSNGSPNVRGAVKSVVVKDANSTPVSRSEVYYDNAGTTANVIETKAWDSFKGGTIRAYSNPLTTTNSISSSATYNGYGMPLTATDSNGVVNTLTYGSVGGYYDLYPTQTVAASNYTAVKRTSTAAYDFYTGLATTVTDVDNNLSVITEYDALGRPEKIRTAANTTLESWTQTEYDDAARRVIVRSDLETIGDGKKVAIQHYDELGRVRLSRSLENSATENPTDETHGIKVQTRYMTSGGYIYSLTSNPYRASYSSGETALTMGWTRSKVVNHGRQSQVETFSGATLPYPFLISGDNTNSTGIVSTDLDANRTLVTDQALKQRISKTNALGQMTDVWEIKASDASTVSVTFPGTSIGYGYQTSYAYDTLNNLLTVGQGSQTRTFTYSSLSRLKSAANPESGTINYLYDSNGNLTRKTDARSIQTNYTYDALNRVTLRDYNDTTLDVTYTYDNLTNAKGRLTKVTSGPIATPFSTTEYITFDILGRVTRSTQATDGVTYGGGTDPNAWMTYKYNLGGAMIEQQYPSGRVVKNVLDNNGDLEIVQSKKNANSGYWSYANSFTYNAAGAVTSMQLGNGKWESTTFNSRLQPLQIALGTVQNGTDKLDLDYTYGTTQNNGNVLTQNITVTRSGQSPLIFNQTYTYDELNRLKSAEEKTGTTTNWKQTFTFDRYGNRNFNQSLTTAPSFADPDVTNPAINTSNNRLSSSNGYSYDAAGNVTVDADGRTFTYDAENKQVEVKNSSSVTLGTYYFDGDGQRVKKVVPSSGETTIFVYDAGGKLVAEYSTNVLPSQDAKVQYLTNDNLGTLRINTDRDGNIASRTDYMPYGEEIIALGGRSSTDKYVADDVRQGFTGYINDVETALDYAQARMYASKLGRFSGSDPLLNSGRPNSPQTWNRYLYTLNNPLAFTDPTGLYECSGTEKECGKFVAGLQKANDQLAKIGKRYGTDSKEYTDAARALNSYGTLGDKNGVTVGFGKLDGNILGSAIGTLSGKSGTGANTVNVTIDLDKNKGGSDLLGTIAHEGSHVQDNLDYQGALLAAANVSESAVNGVMSGGLRVTHGQSETRAFGISSVFAEFAMGGANSESAVRSAGGSTTFSLGGESVRSITVGGEAIWKSSWQKLDIETIRKNRSAAIAKGLPKSDYAPRLDKPIQ